MRRVTLLLAPVLFSIGIALAQGPNLTINDGDAVAAVIDVDGVAYVALDALRAAGMLVQTTDGGWSLRFGPPITGGAGEVRAIEGCAETLLFNGVWRFQVARVERYEERTLRGWDVHVEVRNGTDSTLSPSDFGFHPMHAGIVLALESGKVLTMGTGYVGQIQRELVFQQLPPGASATAVFRFLDEGDDSAPARLVVPVEPDIASFRAEGLAFETDAPSFRIRLDCD